MKSISLVDIPITRKIALGPIIAAGALLLLIASLWALSHYARGEYQRALTLKERAFEAQQTLVDLTEGHALLTRVSLTFTGDDEAGRVARIADEGLRNVREGVRRLEAGDWRDARIAGLAQRYQAAARTLNDMIGLDTSSVALAREEANTHFDRLQRGVAELVSAAQAESEAADAAAQSMERTTSILMVLGALFGVFIAWLVSHRLGQIIAAPLAEIIDRLVSLSQGALEDPIPHQKRRDEIGAVAGALTVFRDTAKELHFRAYHDKLTELANRAAFERMLDEGAAAAVAGGPTLTVMLLDLDRFKEVNDTLGHDAGDDLLVAVAKVLRRVVPEPCKIARLGGDEFAVLLEGDAQRARAEKVAVSIIEALNERFHIKGQDVFIGCSIGVAVAPAHARDKETVLKYADLALYRSKERGRNVHSVFEASLTAERDRLTNIERGLRALLARDGLDIAFQTQVALQSGPAASAGQVIGLEAFMRWTERGEVAFKPSEFIPVAETTGVMARLGEVAAAKALRAWSRLPNRPRLAINISPTQLKSGALLEQLQALLAETGAPAEQIVIELSEPAIAKHAGKDLDALRHALDAFRDLGCGVALDDFGRGSSALNHLQSLPLTEVKLDASFISEMAASPTTAAIVRAVVDVAHAIGLSVVAEGVSTEEQRALAAGAGCDAAQGSLFGDASPAHALMDPLRSGAASAV